MNEMTCGHGGCCFWTMLAFAALWWLVGSVLFQKAWNKVIVHLTGWKSLELNQALLLLGAIAFLAMPRVLMMKQSCAGGGMHSQCQTRCSESHSQCMTGSSCARGHGGGHCEHGAMGWHGGGGHGSCQSECKGECKGECRGSHCRGEACSGKECDECCKKHSGMKSEMKSEEDGECPMSKGKAGKRSAEVEKSK